MKTVKIKKSFALLALVLSLVLILSACGNNNENEQANNTNSNQPEEKQELKVGFMAGPYSDQFKRAIQPILEAKRYDVEVVEFSNAVQPNSSLVDGSIHANVFQHDGYLQTLQEKDQITELSKVPTAPLGIYSSKFTSLDQIEDGAEISISNDASNLARSLNLLQQAGLIKLNADIEPLKVTEKDIVENTKNIKIVPLEAPQLPRSLSDVDYSVIVGNHVIAAGMKLSESLLLENPPAVFQIILAVSTDNKDAQFAKDLVEAYQSDEYRNFVETDPDAIGFSKPNYWN